MGQAWTSRPGDSVMGRSSLLLPAVVAGIIASNIGDAQERVLRSRGIEASEMRSAAGDRRKDSDGRCQQSGKGEIHLDPACVKVSWIHTGRLLITASLLQGPTPPRAINKHQRAAPALRGMASRFAAGSASSLRRGGQRARADTSDETSWTKP